MEMCEVSGVPGGDQIKDEELNGAQLLKANMFLFSIYSRSSLFVRAESLVVAALQGLLPLPFSTEFQIYFQLK